MKKFKFTIKGNEYEAEIINIEDNIAELDVNGTIYNVEIHKEIKTSKTPKLMRPKVMHSIETPTQKTAKPSEKKGAGAINAPLPGTILSLHVKVGDEVKPGDKMLVMEAMKMENNINADRAGKITAIKVNQGDSVLEGETLLEIGS